MGARSPEHSGLLALALLAFGVFAVAMAGYGGFRLYLRLDLPAVESVGLFVLGAAAGIASFFSPCSFPLLATLLARGIDAEGGRLYRAVGFAAALSFGASLFLALTGLGIALGVWPIYQEITFASPIGRLIRGTAGGVLVVLGLIQARVLPFSTDMLWPVVEPLVKAQARLGRGHPGMAFALYGFTYLLAGFG